MSNKQQLQTNNTNLDALITRVNAAKNTAAGLPAASGGGASVEAWTGTVNLSGGALDSSASVLYYVDETLSARILGDDGSTINDTITIAANTILYFSRVMDVVLTNAENITVNQDLEIYGCTVIHPTANNFSISRV